MNPKSDKYIRILERKLEDQEALIRHYAKQVADQRDELERWRNASRKKKKLVHCQGCEGYIGFAEGPYCPGV